MTDRFPEPDLDPEWGRDPEAAGGTGEREVERAIFGALVRCGLHVFSAVDLNGIAAECAKAVAALAAPPSEPKAQLWRGPGGHDVIASLADHDRMSYRCAMVDAGYEWVGPLVLLAAPPSEPLAGTREAELWAAWAAVMNRIGCGHRGYCEPCAAAMDRMDGALRAASAPPSEPLAGTRGPEDVWFMFVDGDKYRVSGRTVTREHILTLIGSPPGVVVYLKVPGQPDMAVRENDKVDLSALGRIPHFSTMIGNSTGGSAEREDARGIEGAVGYLADFIGHEPGTTMRPQREKASSCVALLARLARAALAAPPSEPRHPPDNHALDCPRFSMGGVACTCGYSHAPPSEPLAGTRGEIVDSLVILQTAIHRDDARNACWLAGQAVHVKALERLIALAASAPPETDGGEAKLRERIALTLESHGLKCPEGVKPSEVLDDIIAEVRAARPGGPT